MLYLYLYSFKSSYDCLHKNCGQEVPIFCANYVCPGYVKTDINHNTGVLTIDEGAQSVVRLALMSDDGPFGLFFRRNEVSTFD